MSKHLSKLYDSLAKLKWKTEKEKITKTAIVMIAKDGEEMTIYGDCDCSGKVCSYMIYYFLRKYILYCTLCSTLYINCIYHQLLMLLIIRLKFG